MTVSSEVVLNGFEDLVFKITCRVIIDNKFIYIFIYWSDIIFEYFKNFIQTIVTPVHICCIYFYSLNYGQQRNLMQ